MDGNVECGDGLIGHKELRLERQRSRDRDPLPLAARELMRVARHHLGREAHHLEQLCDPVEPLCLRQAVLHIQRLGNHPCHRHARIERGERILEHDLGSPPEPTQPGALEL